MGLDKSKLIKTGDSRSKTTYLIPTKEILNQQVDPKWEKQAEEQFKAANAGNPNIYGISGEAAVPEQRQVFDQRIADEYLLTNQEMKTGFTGDYDALYKRAADSQGWGSRPFNAVRRFIPGVIAKLGQQVGYAGGAVADLFTGLQTNMRFDNQFSDYMKSWDTSIANYFPIYQRESYKDAPNLLAKMLHSEFTFGEVADGAQFLVSNIIGGKGLGAVSRMATGLKGASTALKAAQATKDVAKIQAAQKTFDTAQKIHNAVQYGGGVGMSTAGEAGMEANETFISLQRELEGRVNPETGKPFTKEEIKTRAASAASGVFNYNVGLLSLSQAIQLKPFLKEGGKKASQEFVDRVVREGITPDKIRTGWDTFKAYGINIASEQFEEGAQNAIQRIEKNWAMGYGEGNINNIVQGIAENYNSFIKALNPMGSLSKEEMEAASAMMVGGLIGSMGGFTEAKEAAASKKEQVQLANDLWSIAKGDATAASRMFLDNTQSILKTFKGADGKEGFLNDKGNTEVNPEVFQKLFYQLLSNKNLANSQFVAASNSDENHMTFNREMAMARAAVEIYNASTMKESTFKQGEEGAQTMARLQAQILGLNTEANIDKMIEDTINEQMSDPKLTELEKAELTSMKVGIKQAIEVYKKLETETKAEFVRNPSKSKAFSTQLQKLQFYNNTKLNALEKMRNDAVMVGGKEKFVEDLDLLIEDTKWYLSEIKNNKEELHKRYNEETGAKEVLTKRLREIESKLKDENITPEERKNLDNEKEKIHYEANEKRWIHGVDWGDTTLYNTTEFDILTNESQRKNNKLGAKHEHFLRQGTQAFVQASLNNQLEAIKGVEVEQQAAKDEKEFESLKEAKRKAQVEAFNYAGKNADVIDEATDESLKNEVAKPAEIEVDKITEQIQTIEEEISKLRDNLDLKKQELAKIEDPSIEEARNMAADAVLAESGAEVLDDENSIASQLVSLIDAVNEGEDVLDELQQFSDSITDEMLDAEADTLSKSDLKELGLSKAGEYVAYIRKNIQGAIINAQDNADLLPSDDEVEALRKEISKIEDEIKALEKELTKLRKDLEDVQKVVDASVKYRSARKPMIDEKDLLKNKMMNKKGEELERFFQRRYAEQPIHRTNKEHLSATSNPDTYSFLQDAVKIKVDLQTTKRVLNSKPELRDSAEFQGYMEKLEKALEMIEEVITIAKANVGKNSARQFQVLQENSESAMNSIGASYTDKPTITDAALFNMIAQVVPNAKDMLESARSVEEGGIIAEIIIQLYKTSASIDQVNALSDYINKKSNKAVDDFVAKGQPSITTLPNPITETTLRGNNYKSNPSKHFMSVIASSLVKYFDAKFKDDETKSPFFKYEQTNDLGQLMTEINALDIPQEIKDFAQQVVKLHQSTVALVNFSKDLSSTFNFAEEFAKERAMFKKIIDTVPDKDKREVPTFQQLNAIRQFVRFFKQSNTPKGDITNPITFAKFIAYMKGIPGTGKTKLVLKWVTEILGIDKAKVYSFSHSENSSKTIAEATGTNQGSLSAFEAQDLSIMELVIIDEAGFFGAVELDKILNKLATENMARAKANKPLLRTILLGDPSQITKDAVSPLENNLSMQTAIQIDPLTVPYRSDVSEIAKVYNMFDRNMREVLRLDVSSNVDLGAEWDGANPTIGVHTGIQNDVMRQFMANRNSGRSKVIVVNTEADKTRYEGSSDYKAVKAANPGTIIEVLTYDKAQGLTFGEVYIDLDSEGNNLRGTKFLNELEFNKAMFTMVSRAQFYVFIRMSGKQDFKNLTDKSISADAQVSKKDKEDNFDRVSELFTTTDNLLNKHLGITSAPIEDGKVEDTTAEETPVEEGVEIVDADSVDPESETAKPLEMEDVVEDKEDPHDFDNIPPVIVPPVDMKGASEQGNVIEITNPESAAFKREQDPKTGEWKYKESVKPGAPVIYIKVAGQTQIYAQVFDNETNKYKQEFVLVGTVSGNEKDKRGDRDTEFHKNHIQSSEQRQAKEGNSLANSQAVNAHMKALASMGKASFDSNGMLTHVVIEDVLIAQATLKSVQGLSFQYSPNVQPKGFVERIIGSFKAGVLRAIGGLHKVEVRIFNHTELEKDKKWQTASFKPKIGVPYLIIWPRSGKPFFIRLTPPRFTKADRDSENGYLNPIKKFMGVVKVYNASLTPEMNKELTLGSTLFNGLVRKFTKNFKKDGATGQPVWEANTYDFEAFKVDIEKGKEIQDHYTHGLEDLTNEQFDKIRDFAKEAIPMSDSYKSDYKFYTPQDAVDDYNSTRPEAEHIELDADGQLPKKFDFEGARLIPYKKKGDKVVSYRKAANLAEYTKYNEGDTKHTVWQREDSLEPGTGLVQQRLNALARTHSKGDVLKFRVEKTYDKFVKGVKRSVKSVMAKAMFVSKDSSFKNFYKNLHKYIQDSLARIPAADKPFTDVELKNAYLNSKSTLEDLGALLARIIQYETGETDIKVLEDQVNEFIADYEQKYVVNPITLEDLENLLGDASWNSEGNHSIPGSGSYLSRPIAKDDATAGKGGKLMNEGVNSLGKDMIVYNEDGSIQSIKQESIDKIEGMLESKFEAVHPTRVQITKDASTKSVDLTDSQVETYANSSESYASMSAAGIAATSINKVLARRDAIVKEKEAKAKAKVTALESDIASMPVDEVRVEPIITTSEDNTQADLYYAQYEEDVRNNKELFNLYVTNKAEFVVAVEKWLKDLEIQKLTEEKNRAEAEAKRLEEKTPVVVDKEASIVKRIKEVESQLADWKYSNSQKPTRGKEGEIRDREKQLVDLRNELEAIRASKPTSSLPIQMVISKDKNTKLTYNPDTQVFELYEDYGDGLELVETVTGRDAKKAWDDETSKIRIQDGGKGLSEDRVESLGDNLVEEEKLLKKIISSIADFIRRTSFYRKQRKEALAAFNNWQFEKGRYYFQYGRLIDLKSPKIKGLIGYTYKTLTSTRESGAIVNEKQFIEYSNNALTELEFNTVIEDFRKKLDDETTKAYESPLDNLIKEYPVLSNNQELLDLLESDDSSNVELAAYVILGNINEVKKKALKDEFLGNDVSEKAAYELAQRLLPGIKKYSLKNLLNVLTFGLLKPMLGEDVVVKFVTKEVLTQLSGGQSLLGYYKAGVVYVLKEYNEKTKTYSVKENTVRHEIFHKIYNEYLTPHERLQLRMSVLRNVDAETKARLENMNDTAFEEYLAEQYQVYRNDKDVAKGRLRTLYDNITSFFTYSEKNWKSMEQLFDKISNGDFHSGRQLTQYSGSPKTKKTFQETYGDVNNMKMMIKIIQNKYADYLENYSVAMSLDDIYYHLTTSIRSDYFSDLRTFNGLSRATERLEAKGLAEDEARIVENRLRIAELQQRLNALGKLFVENSTKGQFSSTHAILDWMFPSWSYKKDKKGVAFGKVDINTRDSDDVAAYDFEQHIRELEETDEARNVNLHEQILEQDRQNQEGKLSAAVKMLLGIISYQKNGKRHFMPGAAAFIKMVESMEGLTFTKEGDTDFLTRFRESMLSLAGASTDSTEESNEVWMNSLYRPLYEKIVDLYTQASRSDTGSLRYLRPNRITGVRETANVTLEHARFLDSNTFVTMSESRLQELSTLSDNDRRAALDEFLNASTSQLTQMSKEGKVRIIDKQTFKELTEKEAETKIEYFTTEDFIETIAKTFKQDVEQVRAIWKVQESRNTLAEFGSHFSSLRSKDFKTVEIVNEQGKRVIKYIGAVSLSTVDATQSHIETALANWIEEKVDAQIAEGKAKDVVNKKGRKTESAQHVAIKALQGDLNVIVDLLRGKSIADAAKGIELFLQTIGLDSLVKKGIPKDSKLNGVATSLAFFITNYMSNVGGFTYNKVKEDNTGLYENEQEPTIISIGDVISTEGGTAFGSLARLLTINDEWIKSSSVKNANGDTVYKENLSTQADDIFGYMINASDKVFKGGSGSKTKLSQPKHLATRFFSNNPFVNGLNKIKALFDHDGIKNKASDNVTPYDRETEQDWMSRTINAGFIDGIRQSLADSKTPTYFQSVYTLAHRKQMRMLKVNVLDQSQIRESLEMYVNQVSDRPYDLIGRIKDFKATNHHNFNIFLKAAKFAGITTDQLNTVQYLKSLKTNAQIKNLLVQGMMNALEQQAVEFAEYLVLNQVPFSANVDTMIEKLYKMEEGQVEGNRFFMSKYGEKEVKSLSDLQFNENPEDRFVDVYDRNEDGTKSYKLTIAQMLPLVDIMYKNMYVNGFFLNQVAMGDANFFKDPLMQVKRMALGFAPGMKGIVNEEFGMKKQFRASVASDVSESLEYTKDFLTRMVTAGQFNSFEDLARLIGESNEEGMTTSPEALASLIKFEREISELADMFGKGGFEWGDGQGFCTPERAEDFKRGFGRAYNVGNIFKGVHYENVVENAGTDQEATYPVSLKYSTIVLSDDLCAKYETLRMLREKMRNHPGGAIDEHIFQSGVKTGSPVTKLLTDGDNVILDPNVPIRDTSILTLSNENYRMQLNPAYEVSMSDQGSVANPTQLSSFLNVLQYVLDTSNFDPSGIVYEEIAKLIRNGASEFYGKFEDKGVFNKSKFVTFIKKILTGVGNERIAEELDGNVDYNAPHIVNKIFSQMASQLGKETVQLRFSGEKLILQSSYGIKIQYPRTKDEDLRRGDDLTYYVDAKGQMVCEVILPRGMFSETMEKHIKDGHNLYAYADALGFRIPSTELHSAVALKVVGFYDAIGTNVIIAPKELVPLHGSDFDVDSLFVITREHYNEENTKTLEALKTALNDIRDGLEKSGSTIPKELEDALEMNPGAPVAHRYNEETQTYEIMDNFPQVIEYMRDEVVDTMFLDETNADKRAKAKDRIFKYLDKLAKDFSKNLIIDTYLKTITDPRFRQRMLQPISKEDFNGTDSKGAFLADSMFAMVQNLQAQRAEQRFNRGVTTEAEYRQELDNATRVQQVPDSSDPRGNYASFKSNMDGLNLVGVFANAMKSLAYMVKAGKNTGSTEELKARKLAKNIESLKVELEARKQNRDTHPEITTEDKNKLRGIRAGITKLDNKIKELEVQLAALNESAKTSEVKSTSAPYTRYKSSKEDSLSLVTLLFNNKEYNRLTEFNDREDRTTWQIIDALLNSAIDNVKDQILPVINANGMTANSIAAALALGIPLKTVVLLMKQPSIVQMKGYGKKESIIDAQTSKLAAIVHYLKTGSNEGQNKVREELKERLENGESVTDDMMIRGFIGEFDYNTIDSNNMPRTIEALQIQTGKNTDELVQYLSDQIMMLIQFRQLAVIGEDIANMSSALNIIRNVPAFKWDYDSIKEKWDTVFTKDEKGKLKLNESFSFQIPNFLEANPHIQAAYDTVITKFGKTISQAFVKHRDHFEKRMYELFGKMKVKLDKNTSRSKVLFVDEFVRMVFTSIPSMKGEEIQSSVYTYNSLIKEEQKILRGPRAWSQDFAHRLHLLVKASKKDPKLASNRFLSSIIIEKNPYTQLYEVKMGATNNLQYHDIIELQQAFIELGDYNVITSKGKTVIEKSETTGYTQLQHDFVRFAVINFGLKFSSQNYSMILPPDLIKPYVDEMVSTMEDLVDGTVTKKVGEDEITVPKYETLMDYFSLQAALNNAEDLPYVDTNQGKNLITTDVSLKFKGTDIDVVRLRGWSQELGVFYDFAVNRTEGKSYPQFISRSDFKSGSKIVYMKIEETEDGVYYKLIGNAPKNKAAVNYYLDPKLLNGEKTYDINVSMNHSIPEIGVETMPTAKSSLVKIPDGYIGVGNSGVAGVQVGSVMRVYLYDDISRLNFKYYKITSLDLEKSELTYPKDISGKELIGEEPTGVTYRAHVQELSAAESNKLSEGLEAPMTERDVTMGKEDKKRFDPHSVTTPLDWHGLVNDRSNSMNGRELLEKIAREGSPASKVMANFLLQSDVLSGVAESTILEFVDSLGTDKKGNKILGVQITSKVNGKNRISGVKISKDTDSSKMEATVIHELIHVMTTILLKTPHSQLSRSQIHAQKQLRDLYNKAKELWKKTPEFEEGQFKYRFSNMDEFMAGALSDFEFQTFLSKMDTSKNQGSFLSNIMKWIMELFGLEGTFDDWGVKQVFYKSNSVLHEVMANTMLLTHNDSLTKQQQVNQILESDKDIKLNEELYSIETENELRNELIPIRDKGAQYQVALDPNTQEQLDHYVKIGDESSKLKRITDTLTGFLSNFLPKSMKTGKDWKEQKINNAYKDVVDHEKDEIWFGGKLRTKAQAKEYLDTTSALGIAKGKVIHSIIELMTHNPFSTRPKKDIEAERDSYMDMLYEDGRGLEYLKWVGPAVQKIFGKLGINYFQEKIKPEDKDIPLAETTIVNEELGFAGTPDMIVKHQDGTYSIIDWKTGASFDDVYEYVRMTYGDQVENIFNNPKSKAKLQIMMYAVMMKMQNPALRFKNLVAAWVPNEYQAQGEDALAFVNEASYLEMIRLWMKDTMKKERYAEVLKRNPNLFSMAEYGNRNTEARNLAMNKKGSNQSQMELLQAEIQITINSYEDPKMMSKDVQDEIAEKMQTVLEMADDGGYSIKAWDDDISNFDKWFGITSNVSHPSVQMYNQVLQEAKMNATREMESKMSTFRSMLAPILEAYQKDQGTVLGKAFRALSGVPLFKGLRKMFTDVDYIKMYGFMYKDIDQGGDKIKAILVESDQAYKDLAKEGEIGRIKQRFISFVNDTFGEGFNPKDGFLVTEKVRRIPYGKDSNGKLIFEEANYIESYNHDLKRLGDPAFEWYRGLLPTVPQDAGDLMSKYGKLKSFGKRVKMWLVQNFTYFFENSYEGVDQNETMIPLKYLGNRKIRAAQAHTLNMETIFEKFMTNQYQKKYGEKVSVFGRAMSTYLKSTKGKGKYERVTDFIEKQIEMQVRGFTERELNESRKGIVISGGKDGVVAKFSFAKFVEFIGKFTSATTMWGNFTGGARNGASAMFIVARRALANKTLRILDSKKLESQLTEDNLDFTLKNFGAGIWSGAWDTFIGKAMQGDIRSDKTWLLLKHLNYLPSVSNWGGLSKNDFMTAVNKITSTDTAYLTYSMPEEAVSAVTMVAQLKSLKFNMPGTVHHGKTMWDMYNPVTRVNEQGVKETVIEYTGPTRGLIKKGGELIPLKGLDSNEIQRMKRIYTEMQGAYRPEEKTRMDYYVMGRAVSQFKKYFPQILKNGLASKSEDYAIGSYKPDTKINPETGKEEVIYKDGEKLLKWVSEVQEGRWRVFGKVLANYLGVLDKINPLGRLPYIGTFLGKKLSNSQYNFTQLSQRDRLNFVEGVITMAMILGSWAIYATAFADADDDDKALRTLKVLADNSFQQWNAMEVFKNASYYLLPASAGKAYKTAEAVTSYGFSWLAFSEIAPWMFRNGEDGLTTDGQIEGAHQLVKSIPGMSAIYSNLLDAQEFGIMGEGPTVFSTFGAR